MDVLRNAFLAGQTDFAKTLIGQMPQGAFDGSSATLLHLAANTPDTGEATRIALDLGHGIFIDARASAYNDETPLHVAIRRGNIRGFLVMSSLITPASVSQTTADECAELAAQFGQHQILLELIKRVPPTPPAVKTALVFAAENQYVHSCVVLFIHYKEIVVRLFPRIVACALKTKNRRDEMVAFARQIVIECPTAIHACESDGRTALHVAARYSTPDSAKFTRFLIDNQASVGALDRGSVSPMDIALARKSYDCLALMLAVPNCPVTWKKSERGASLYNKILTLSNIQLFDAMLVGNRHMRTDHNLIKYLMVSKNKKLFKHALVNYPELAAAQSPLGRNILLCATFDTSVERYYFDTILALGEFDIDATDNTGNTALHYAAKRGNEDMIRRLLEVERDSSVTHNRNGELPIDCCLGVSKTLMIQMLRNNRTAVPSIETLARICEGATTEMIEFITRPPTMVEHLIEAERMFYRPASRRRRAIE